MTHELENVIQMREEVRTLLDKMGDDIPAKVRPSVEDLLIKMETGTQTLSEAMGLTPEILELFYQQGYLFFQSGKYDQALSVFRFLRGVYSEDPRFTFGIAACLHYQKEYLAAAGNYLLYISMKEGDPTPFLHLYDCLKKSGHQLLAESALDMAEKLTEGHPEYAVWKGKIELEKQK